MFEFLQDLRLLGGIGVTHPFPVSRRFNRTHVLGASTMLAVIALSLF